MFYIIVKDASAMAPSLRLALVWCAVLEHAVVWCWSPGNSARIWRRLQERQEPWDLSTVWSLPKLHLKKTLVFSWMKLQGS